MSAYIHLHIFSEAERELQGMKWVGIKASKRRLSRGDGPTASSFSHLSSLLRWQACNHRYHQPDMTHPKHFAGFPHLPLQTLFEPPSMDFATQWASAHHSVAPQFSHACFVKHVSAAQRLNTKSSFSRVSRQVQHIS